MLRDFFVELSKFQYGGYDDPDPWKEKVGVSIATEITDGKITESHPISDYFARRSFEAVSPDDFETEGAINCSIHRAETMRYMLESLGFPYMPELSVHKRTAMMMSSRYPLGWAIYNRDMGFARHLMFEVGDEKNHLRFDIKDSWSGDDFKTQIDQITLWDKTMEYSIPCYAFGDFEKMCEDIVGTVNPAVRALYNDDEEQAKIAFDQIEDFKAEYLNVVTPLNLKPTP